MKLVSRLNRDILKSINCNCEEKDKLAFSNKWLDIDNFMLLLAYFTFTPIVIFIKIVHWLCTIQSKTRKYMDKTRS